MNVNQKTLFCDECSGGRHANCMGTIGCVCYAQHKEHERFVGSWYGIQPTPEDREYLEQEARTVAEIAGALMIAVRVPRGRIGDTLMMGYDA